VAFAMICSCCASLQNLLGANSEVQALSDERLVSRQVYWGAGQSVVNAVIPVAIAGFPERQKYSIVAVGFVAGRR